jgi:antibiotic biosynthesis monooxygenase (ABM) superfamily enzyme
LDSQPPYRYSHCIFFQLSDRTPSTRKKFLELTRKLLASGHPGMISCEIGFRDVDMRRPVNDQKFDIAVEMIFENREAYQAYRVAATHDEWITVAGSMSLDRVVFDSFLFD